MSTTQAADRLIVALDVDAQAALDLAQSLEGTVSWLKVGMTLFYESGPTIVTQLRERGFNVFLDLKLHDIPHQVDGAAARLAALDVQMLTVHAAGGPDMVMAAVAGASRTSQELGFATPSVLAVTVLTSMDEARLRTIGIERPVAEQVPLLAAMASGAGAAGVVCSPHEAAHMRDLLGPKALVVTPGVRPLGAEMGDQARAATPALALGSGASHLVVGRPITSAGDPAEAAARIITEMEETHA